MIPDKYAHRNAVGWSWADSFRADRINEVLGTGKKFELKDMMALQCDYLSIPARTLIPFLHAMQAADEKTETARQFLLKWNFVMDQSSIPAGLYAAWEKRIGENILTLFVPEAGRTMIKSVPLSKVIKWIVEPGAAFGTNPGKGRDQFLLTSLQDAVADLTKKLGTDMNQWQYGQAVYHHVLIKHPLSNVVDEETRKKLDAGPLPRGGNGATPGMTTNVDNQQAGATFRMVVDVADWDKAMFTNAPGQSGDPQSPFYKNLFNSWANDQYFPIYYSREKIEKGAIEKSILKPLR